jgi:hypothetical protein
MEAKGHITGSCSSVYDNVHVDRQECANMEQPGRTNKRDEHVQKTRKMEGKGPTGGVCSSM